MGDKPKKFTVSVDSTDGTKVETFEAEMAYEAVLEAFRAGMGPVGSFKMTVTEGDAYMIDLPPTDSASVQTCWHCDRAKWLASVPSRDVVDQVRRALTAR